MTHLTLNFGNIELPSVVFGCSSLGNLYRELSPETKREIVAAWLQHSPGVVVVDTAGKYGAGLALESMATALNELPVDPQRIVISNKLGWRRVPLTTPEPTFEPGAWVGLQHDAVQDISRDGILRCWEQGCELLGEYQPQLASVHDPDEYLAAATDEHARQSRWNDIIGAYSALNELKQAGSVKAVGVGSKDWRIIRQLVEECSLDWVMLATSLTVYRHEPALLEFIDDLHQRNIAVLNSAVFHSGFLTGGEFFDYRKIDASNSRDGELIQWRQTFHSICQRHNVSPAQACVSFGMSVPGVVATAINSSRPERVADNVELASNSPPNDFWLEMKNEGLIWDDFPYAGI